MDDRERFSALGRELVGLLRLRSYPLALRLIREGEDFPEATRFPSRQLGVRPILCQALTMARTYGWTVGVTKEDLHLCPGLLFFGWMEVEEGALERFWVQDLPFFKDEAAARRFIDESRRFSLPRGEYRGLVASPLEWTRVEPQVVMVFCNPAQMMRLVHASVFRDGLRMSSSHACLMATCMDGILVPLATGQPQPVLPGVGDRVIGLLQDDEVIFSIPAQKLEEVVEGLRVRRGTLGGIRYPIPIYWLQAQPSMPYDAIADKFRRL